MTIYTRIRGKVSALINAGRPGSIPAPKQLYLLPIDQAELPLLNVRMGVSAPLIDATAADKIQPIDPTVFQAAICHVDIVDKGDGSIPPDEKIDPILAWVVKKCAGYQETSAIPNQDRVLIQIEPGPRIVPQAEQVEYPYIYTRVDLVVMYQTRADDPELWA